MKDTELKYYFPYSFEKRLNLKERVKDRDTFIDELKGKNEYFFIDEGNRGTQRNRDHLSPLQCSINDYLASEFYTWESWVKNGRNIFSFSKELLEMLNHTDVSEITYESFHLPYDNFYISLRPLGIKSSKESDVIVEGVYIYINRDQMSNRYSENKEDIDQFAIEFHFVGDFEKYIYKYHDKVWNESGSGGYSFWTYAFYFNKYRNITTVKEAIDDWKTTFSYSLFPENGEEVTDGELDIFNHYLYMVEATSTIIVNCLLYLSMKKQDKDIETYYPLDLPFNYNRKLALSRNKSEIAKIESKIETSGYSKIQYVGQSYKSKKIENGCISSSVSPHWRRGHWRNQKYGVNLQNQKLVWIKPLIVNQEKGKPGKGHIYI